MDIVNAYFRQFYPPDYNTAWELRYIGGGYGHKYNGTANGRPTIFPSIVCADGFDMSVQGHFGAYSMPRDDFADNYSEVEIMCPREEMLEQAREGYDVGEERVYAYVPIAVVIAVIEKHGGMVS